MISAYRKKSSAGYDGVPAVVLGTMQQLTTRRRGRRRTKRVVDLRTILFGKHLPVGVSSETKPSWAARAVFRPHPQPLSHRVGEGSRVPATRCGFPLSRVAGEGDS